MYKALTIAGLTLLPAVVMAQSGAPTVGGAESTAYLNSIIDFINNTIVPFIVAIAIVVFIIGIFWYFILGGSDETKKDKGKKFMIWGLVGFVLIFAIQGIVNLLVDLTGLRGEAVDSSIAPIPGLGGGSEG